MDRKQTTLFDDYQTQQSRTDTKTGLKIAPRRDKKLSKEQQTFNRLTKKIERLQEEIHKESAKLEKVLSVYLAKVSGPKRLLANKRLEVAKAIGETTKTIKYSRRQMQNVRRVILVLCDEAFADIQPDEETERFYDEWAEVSYKEELRSRMDMMKSEVADHIRDVFGVDLAPEDFDDTPEGLARLTKKLTEELEDKEKMEQGASQKRRISKKQLAREEFQKEQAERTQRSMRNIFISLSKALHPDTITEPDEKERKEELMKKVTAAYAEKDLFALLKLEMEWARSEDKALDMLPDEQLKLYVTSLKEQVDDLEAELASLYMDPRFMDISHFAMHSHDNAVRFIHDLAHDHTRVMSALDESMRAFSGAMAKKAVIEFAEEYLSLVKDMERLEEEFMRGIF